jgi:hypothetical protein
MCVGILPTYVCVPLVCLGPMEAREPNWLSGRYFFFFRDGVSLYSSGCPGAHFVDQVGLELRNPPASASRVLGLKVSPRPAGNSYKGKHLFNWGWLTVSEVQSVIIMAVCRHGAGGAGSSTS